MREILAGRRVRVGRVCYLLCLTRVREDVTIVYGKDEVRKFGDLLAQTQRHRGKVLVRDVEREFTMRVAREIQREQKQQRLRPVIEQWQDAP